MGLNIYAYKFKNKLIQDDDVCCQLTGYENVKIDGFRSSKTPGDGDFWTDNDWVVVACKRMMCCGAAVRRPQNFKDMWGYIDKIKHKDNMERLRALVDALEKDPNLYIYFCN